MAKSKSDISLNDLKAMLPQEGSSAEQEAALRALSTLSPEDQGLRQLEGNGCFRHRPDRKGERGGHLRRSVSLRRRAV